MFFEFPIKYVTKFLFRVKLFPKLYKKPLLSIRIFVFKIIYPPMICFVSFKYFMTIVKLEVSTSIILNKFSTVENLIKFKRSGDCNVVHNDCTIAFEPWSNTLLKNRPIGDNNPVGILISFYHGRRVQLYISGNTMYTRVNQGSEDYNSWLQWVKCSN